MAFFIVTIVQTQLMQSGAFEIYINGNLEFSKLQSGKMPNLHDIVSILSKHNVNLWSLEISRHQTK